MTLLLPRNFHPVNHQSDSLLLIHPCSTRPDVRLSIVFKSTVGADQTLNMSHQAGKRSASSCAMLLVFESTMSLESEAAEQIRRFSSSLEVIRAE